MAARSSQAQPGRRRSLVEVDASLWDATRLAVPADERSFGPVEARIFPVVARAGRLLLLSGFEELPARNATTVCCQAGTSSLQLSGSVTIDRSPSVTLAWVAITGVAPDGRRYLINGPSHESTAFNGTAMDWLTAVIAGR